jgi:ubiquitin C-terminal hydrolase
MRIAKVYLIVWLLLISNLIGCTGCFVNLNTTEEKKNNDPEDHAYEPYGDIGGLTNIGNTCYLNAALQIIARIGELNRIFDYQGTDPDKKQLAALGKKLIINLRDKTKRASDNEILIRKFYEILEKLGWPALGRQQNLHDLMITIFSELDYPVLKGHRITRSTNNKDEQTKERLNNFLICGIDKINNEVPSMQARVNCALAKEISLEGELTSKIFIDSDNLILPVACEFSSDPDEVRAILAKNSAVSYTTEVMKIVIPKGSVTGGSRYDLHYSLAGFIVRSGSTVDSGHYISYVKDNAQWHKYDDSSVCVITDNEAGKLAKAAYLYFYIKD